jgi:hypothetical protein
MTIVYYKINHVLHRLPACAGNALFGTSVGYPAQTNLDYDKWTADFRAGKSFVTSGPPALLKVNGREPGDEIRLPAGKHTVKVDVEVKSITPVESIEVMHNGKPLGDVKTVTLDRSGWISVQVKAKYTRDPIRRPYPLAATMPVWITVDGKPVRSKADAEYFVQWIDGTLERAMQLSFNNEMERNETRKLYQEARAKMMQRAAEAEW